MKTKGILFVIGAAGYGLIEIIWRGYTHISMLLAGGICFNIFSVIAKKCKQMSRIKIFFVGSLAVTAVEFVFGCIFNLMLRKNVWNYSKQPLNILGQICLLYSFFWGILSLFFIPLAGRCEKYISRGLQK